MSDDDIRVRFEPDSDGLQMFDDTESRPVLTWGRYASWEGWNLWYLDDPGSPTAGVEHHFIGGDALDTDDAVAEARSWLSGRSLL